MPTRVAGTLPSTGAVADADALADSVGGAASPDEQDDSTRAPTARPAAAAISLA
jgi:hypothetical protein